ncbi:MAG: ABC transporter permease, partial [Blautia sp.]|nr:ABC transporter permease [Blautia sp.]
KAVDESKSRNVAILSIQEKDAAPVLEITVSNFLSKVQADTIADACNKIWQSHLLTENGLEKGEVDAIQTPLIYTQRFIGNMNLTEYVVGLLLTFVMFFAVYYYGYGVAMSISSEKTSRVMETLIISAKPSKILIGKCLAMGVVGLLQLVGLMAFAAFCYKFILPEGFQIAGVDLAVSGFTPKTLVFLIIYFILGYALYAVMNSVCGAAVSKMEDLNSAMMPVSILVIIGFYLGYFTSVMGGGSGAMSNLAIYLPISAPFAVPFKLITGEITMQELGISILLLVLAIVIVTMFSVRIYSASVMHYGNRLKWKELKKIKTN